MGSPFFPSNHSSASRAQSGPAVSGYRSSWNRSDCVRVCVEERGWRWRREDGGRESERRKEMVSEGEEARKREHKESDGTGLFWEYYTVSLKSCYI